MSLFENLFPPKKKKDLKLVRLKIRKRLVQFFSTSEKTPKNYYTELESCKSLYKGGGERTNIYFKRFFFFFFFLFFFHIHT